MKNSLELRGFTLLDECEATAVRGGVDKQAQEALYMIGYAIGVVVKLFVSLFSLIGRIFK